MLYVCSSCGHDCYTDDSIRIDPRISTWVMCDECGLPVAKMDNRINDNKYGNFRHKMENCRGAIFVKGQHYICTKCKGVGDARRVTDRMAASAEDWNGK